VRTCCCQGKKNGCIFFYSTVRTALKYIRDVDYFSFSFFPFFPFFYF
jgi:hypothetical protein